MHVEPTIAAAPMDEFQRRSWRGALARGRCTEYQYRLDPAATRSPRTGPAVRHASSCSEFQDDPRQARGLAAPAPSDKASTTTAPIRRRQVVPELPPDDARARARPTPGLQENDLMAIVHIRMPTKAIEDGVHLQPRHPHLHRPRHRPAHHGRQLPHRPLRHRQAGQAPEGGHRRHRRRRAERPQRDPDRRRVRGPQPRLQPHAPQPGHHAGPSCAR